METPSLRRSSLLLLCYRANRGFTLLELLVVFIIAGILAAIALPSFLNQANRAKQVEARAHIGIINRAQQAYYTEKLQFTSNIGDLGIALQAQTTNYRYEIDVVSSGGFYAVNHGVSLNPNLKSYVGMVALMTINSGETMTQTALCEASNVGATRANTPNLSATAISCSGGTSPLN